MSLITTCLKYCPINEPHTHKHTYTHTHTQTCKHRQTGSSHCSSFVYTLTFSQHLSYVLYTFGKRGPFSNWGPYCSFCYKSPANGGLFPTGDPIVPFVISPRFECLNKRTHTHTHTHTQTCKHRQNCSSFVYTLTFSQHICFVHVWHTHFCYKSPV